MHITELELCTEKSEIDKYLEKHLKAGSDQETKLKLKINYLADYMCIQHIAATVGLTLQEEYDDLLETFLLGTWRQMCRKHDRTDYDSLFRNL